MQIKFYLFNDGAEKFMNFLKYFLVQWALLFCGRCVWGLPLIYVGVERGPPLSSLPLPPPNEWNGWLAAFNLKEEKNGHNRTFSLPGIFSTFTQFRGGGGEEEKSYLLNINIWYCQYLIYCSVYPRNVQKKFSLPIWQNHHTVSFDPIDLK